MGENLYPIMTGKIIREERERRDIRQNELADRLGVSAPYLNQWENGKFEGSDRLIEKAAVILDLDADSLLDEKRRAEFKSKLERLQTSYRDVVKAEPAVLHDGLHSTGIAFIPIFAEVPTGSAQFMAGRSLERVEDYITIPKDGYVISAKCFAVRVGSDSMTGKLEKGDIAVIDPDQQPESGEMALVLIDSEATIKQVEFSNGAVILRSAKDGVKSIVVGKDSNNVRIEGRVVMRITRY